MALEKRSSFAFLVPLFEAAPPSANCFAWLPLSTKWLCGCGGSPLARPPPSSVQIAPRVGRATMSASHGALFPVNSVDLQRAPSNVPLSVGHHPLGREPLWAMDGSAGVHCVAPWAVGPSPSPKNVSRNRRGRGEEGGTGSQPFGAGLTSEPFSRAVYVVPLQGPVAPGFFFMTLAA